MAGLDISHKFIDKPILAGVLSFFIFIAGVISVFSLPISEYPEVVPPQVVVQAAYPGANPKVISETVAAPLEEQINGVSRRMPGGGGMGLPVEEIGGRPPGGGGIGLPVVEVGGR